MRSKTDSRRSFRTRLLVPVLAALVAAGAAAAQQQPAPPQQEAQQEPSRPEAPADEFGRGTPRSSVDGFLVAANKGNWERASRYLDLSPIPRAEREQRGPRLARELKLVIDRNFWVDQSLISDDPKGDLEDGLPSRRERIGVIDSAKLGKVPVLLDRITRKDGTPIWKFAPATVAQIPELYKEFGYGPLERFLPSVFFETRLFEIQLWQWLALLPILLLAWLGSWLVVAALVGAARPVLARSQTDLDDRVFDAVVGPLRLFVALGIFGLCVAGLGLTIPAERLIFGAERVLAIVAGAWLSLRLVDVFSDVLESRLQERGQSAVTTIVPLGRKTAKALFVVVAVLAALDSLGFNVTALVAGLGIGGLAVALALQKTLENLFGGATLLADRPVKVGDFCRFGDKVGTVEEIGLRSTRVRTLDRTVVTIPNAEFATMQLENFAKRDRIWYHPTIGLRYETTPEQLRYVLVEVRKMLYAHPRVDQDGARIRFTRFGAYSLDLEIFSYVLATDYGEFLEVAEDLNLRIMDIVEAAGTGFAFPSSTTYVARDDGLDAEQAHRAEAEVQGWRDRGELCLPGFPPERVKELHSTLDYPPVGSAVRGDGP